MTEYNRSENATRNYTITGEGGFTGLGKRYLNIKCPFCGTITRAYLWSLYGGGKLCPHVKCRAKHCKGGYTIPRVGREDMTP